MDHGGHLPWRCDPGTQVSLYLELRGMEQLPSFHARDAQLLWCITSTLSDAVGVTVRASDDLGRMRSGQRVGQDAREQAAERVLGAMRHGQEALLANLPTVQEDHADRAVLWLHPVSRLLTTAWFNPKGPTITTLELCSGPDGDGRYLVEFMRHPFTPRYLVLARCDSDDDLRSALPDALEDVFVGSIPNMLTMRECPGDLSADVLATVRNRIGILAAENDTDLIWEARRLGAHRGRPWDWVDQWTPTDEQEAMFEPLDADDVTTWLAQAAHPENVDSVLRVFPEAWDGALNYQMSLGNMARGFFDTGPLFITYDKKIGWVPSE